MIKLTQKGNILIPILIIVALIIFGFKIVEESLVYRFGQLQIPSFTLKKGEVLEIERYRVFIPFKSYGGNIKVNLRASPNANISDEVRSIIYSLSFSAKDESGNETKALNKDFTITADFGKYELKPFKTESITLYHSRDWNNWIKLETTVNLNNRTATAKSKQLGHFALMAERVDTIPPNTKFILNENELILVADDNENGLGVDYTLYKIDDLGWQEYTSPIVFEKPGVHAIDFYSVDNDENTEEIKTALFKIQKARI